MILNQLGWASALGLRTGIFGKGADDENGRILRAAMDRAGIEHHLVLDGSATSVAAIFVEPGGERAIYFDPAASAETTAAHVREHHPLFIARGARLTTEVHQVPLGAVLEALTHRARRRTSRRQSTSTCRPRKPCRVSATRRRCMPCSQPQTC